MPALRRTGVGEKIYHEDYGEGMVVEVRPRPFFDILEVAFADRVRRLNSNHPKISETPPVQLEKPAPEAPVEPDSASPARKRATRAGRSKPVEEPQDKDGEPSAPETTEDEELERFSFQDSQTLSLNHDSVDAILKIRAPAGDDGLGFRFAVTAERMSMTRGFEKLLALSAVRDLDRYDFQIQACLRVLRQMRGRALLADEVGLGKTIEAGLILKEYVLRGLVRRALVLTPVSLMTQWREELIHKFDLHFDVYSRGQAWDASPFLIASIDTAKTEKNREEIGSAGFDLLIVDEAHRLRNHLTQGWKFVDALRLKYLLLLTATPVQNELRELFNLSTLLKPGLLGTYRSFRKEHMMRGDKRLPKNTRQLARTLSQVMVRTGRSSTAIKFPEREVRIVTFEMSPQERKLYNGVAEFIRDVAEESDPKDFPRWQLLLMVLQKEMGSSAWAAVKTLERSRRIFKGTPYGRRLSRLAAIGHAIERHNKAEGLLDLVRQEKDEKVLVFTQFRRTLEFLQERLRELGEEPAIFHGSLSVREKDQAVEQFRNSHRILLSTESGGEGRNLQFCRILVNYDLPWNPMRIEQRIGRVHRLGQTRDTRIYNFTTRDTVEDHVLRILSQKIQMFELVVGEMDMVLGQLSDRFSFESEVFRIWAGYRDSAHREEAFEKLGEDLLIARQRHERVKDFDEAIFTRLDSSLALDSGKESGA